MKAVKHDRISQKENLDIVYKNAGPEIIKEKV